MANVSPQVGVVLTKVDGTAYELSSLAAGAAGGPITVASGAVASGAFASGALASGSVAAGAIVQLPAALGQTTTALSLSTGIASDDVRTSTKTWVQPARITTNAASETVLLAAATATKLLIVTNVHASESINIAIDNTAATSTHGIAVAAGRGLVFQLGEVPAGKISGYTTNAGTIEIAYV
jgi:translation initiation factor 2 gamma subunit (eIF-2gamma)